MAAATPREARALGLLRTFCSSSSPSPPRARSVDLHDKQWRRRVGATRARRDGGRSFEHHRSCSFCLRARSSKGRTSGARRARSELALGSRSACSVVPRARPKREPSAGRRGVQLRACRSSFGADAFLLSTRARRAAARRVSDASTRFRRAYAQIRRGFKKATIAEPSSRRSASRLPRARAAARAADVRRGSHVQTSAGRPEVDHRARRCGAGAARSRAGRSAQQRRPRGSAGARSTLDRSQPGRATAGALSDVDSPP